MSKASLFIVPRRLLLPSSKREREREREIVATRYQVYHFIYHYIKGNLSLKFGSLYSSFPRVSAIRMKFKGKYRRRAFHGRSLSFSRLFAC